MDENELLARVAARNITRAVEPCHDEIGWGVLTAMLALACLAGIVWLAGVHDDIRATRHAVEVHPCR